MQRTHATRHSRQLRGLEALNCSVTLTHQFCLTSYSLIGAVFDPLLCFVLPSIMLYKSGLPMTPLDKAGALFYVFVVGVFAWGPGTGVAIYSIAESSDDVGGPFSCQCIAKQCST